MIAARLFGALVVVSVLQMELFAELRVFGVMPELLLGLTIASGWAAGADRGAVAGFTSGVVYDVFLSTPFALTALSYTLVGYAVGVIAESAALATERNVRRLVSLLAVAMGSVQFALLGELLTGSSFVSGSMVRVALVAPLLTAPFMGLLHHSADWVWRSESQGAPTRRAMGVLE